MMKNKLSILFVTLAIAFVANSCDDNDNYLPKPRGYFRIDLPEKSYTRVDTIEKYSFQYPEYAFITPDPYSPNENILW